MKMRFFDKPRRRGDVIFYYISTAIYSSSNLFIKFVRAALSTNQIPDTKFFSRVKNRMNNQKAKRKSYLNFPATVLNRQQTLVAAAEWPLDSLKFRQRQICLRVTSSKRIKMKTQFDNTRCDIYLILPSSIFVSKTEVITD